MEVRIWQPVLTPLVIETFRKKKTVASCFGAFKSDRLFIWFSIGGNGVGFLPRMVAEKRNVKNVKMVEITDKIIEWHMALIWRSNSHLSYPLANGCGCRVNTMTKH